MAEQIDTVETMAALQNLDVTGRNYVQVGGYYAAHDGGGGLFKWHAGATDTADDGLIFNSAVASGRWKRVFHTNELWAEWWGAKGDGVNDDAPAIQAAIDYLLSSSLSFPEHADGYNRGGTLLFSGRKCYLCESSLLIYQLNAQSIGITLKGVTPAYVVGGSPVLKFNYNDKPGIVIQTGRNIHIENLIISGVNDYMSQFASFNDYAIDANYIKASASVRTNRYSPYAAISIDSFENTVTSGNQYPGLSALYANNPGGGSKQIHIVNCTILNWYVGVMLNSSAANAQGDGCFIHHNYFQSCTYAMAIGQTQSRSVTLRDNEIDTCKVAFDCVTFGQQNGTPPHIQGGLTNGVKYLFLMGGTGIGNLEVDGLYAEVLISLGVVAAVVHPNNMPVLFKGCQFSFVETTKQAEAHLIFGGDVKFVGCQLGAYGAGCLYFQVLTSTSSDSASIEFDNTTLRTENPSGESEIYVSAFTHARWRGAAYFDPYWSANISSGERQPLTEQRTVKSIANVNRKVVTPGERIVTPNGIYIVECAENVVNIGSSHSIAFDGNGGATLTLPTTGLFKVGDIVRGAESNGWFNITVQGMAVYNLITPKVGVISNIVGTTATLIEVPSYLDSGSVTLTNLEVVCMKRFHQLTTGDVANGTNTITNCSVSGGTSLSNTWFAGNRISGLGIPDGAFVTNVSGTTLTISKNASANHVGTPLCDAHYSTMDATTIV
jgi:hypothetical protein